MASYGTTAKYALRKLLGASLVSEVDSGFAALADDIDGKMVGYSQGVLASRPVSTGGSPGIAGRRYRATDTGQEFIDTGTSWIEIYRSPMRARITRTSTQSITTSTPTLVDFTASPSFSSGLAVDLSTNNSITLGPAGLYLIHAGVTWGSSGGTDAGERRVTICAAPGAAALEVYSVRSGPPVQGLSTFMGIALAYYSLSGGEQVGLAVQHTQGATLQITNSHLTVQLAQL